MLVDGGSTELVRCFFDPTSQGHGEHGGHGGHDADCTEDHGHGGHSGHGGESHGGYGGHGDGHAAGHGDGHAAGHGAAGDLFDWSTLFGVLGINSEEESQVRKKNHDYCIINYINRQYTYIIYILHIYTYMSIHPYIYIHTIFYLAFRPELCQATRLVADMMDE